MPLLWLRRQRRRTKRGTTTATRTITRKTMKTMKTSHLPWSEIRSLQNNFAALVKDHIRRAPHLTSFSSVLKKKKITVEMWQPPATIVLATVIAGRFWLSAVFPRLAASFRRRLAWRYRCTAAERRGGACYLCPCVRVRRRTGLTTDRILQACPMYGEKEATSAYITEQHRLLGPTLSWKNTYILISKFIQDQR